MIELIKSVLAATFFCCSLMIIKDLKKTDEGANGWENIVKIILMIASMAVVIYLIRS